MIACFCSEWVHNDAQTAPSQPLLVACAIAGPTMSTGARRGWRMDFLLALDPPGMWHEPFKSCLLQESRSDAANLLSCVSCAAIVLPDETCMLLTGLTGTSPMLNPPNNHQLPGDTTAPCPRQQTCHGNHLALGQMTGCFPSPAPASHASSTTAAAPAVAQAPAWTCRQSAAWFLCCARPERPTPRSTAWCMTPLTPAAWRSLTDGCKRTTRACRQRATCPGSVQGISRQGMRN